MVEFIKAVYKASAKVLLASYSEFEDAAKCAASILEPLKLGGARVPDVPGIS